MNDQPERLFNAAYFGQQVRAHIERAGSLRKAAAAHVSPSTMSRICSGDPNTSHENVLRVEAWLQGLNQQVAA